MSKTERKIMVLSLATRMKRYEDVSRTSLSPRTPVIVRLDGRAFHTYARAFLPFDHALRESMVEAGMEVARHMQGFEIGYHQSDEISFLLTDYAEINTACWFEYVVQKVSSISSSIMTAHFNWIVRNKVWHDTDSEKKQKRFDKLLNAIGEPKTFAYFDARVFNIPREDVSNYFLWRCKDWERNSLAMYCSQFFSHKQLQGKDSAARHEMLHSIGKNWAKDIEPAFKNGTFFTRREGGFEQKIDVQARYDDVARLVEPLVYKLLKVQSGLESSPSLS